MKKRILSIVALAALVALPMSVFAQDFEETTTSTGKVNIVSAIQLANGTDGTGAGATTLDFGVVIPSTTAAGTVTVTPDAGGVPSYGFTEVTTLGSSYSSANFYVSGGADATYTVTLPSSLILHGVEGSNPLKITSFSSSLVGNAGALDNTGKSTFYVGGVLSVPAGYASGFYSKTFNVTVQYN